LQIGLSGPPRFVPGGPIRFQRPADPWTAPRSRTIAGHPNEEAADRGGLSESLFRFCWLASR
jgi:hypothetical protein